MTNRWWRPVVLSPVLAMAVGACTVAHGEGGSTTTHRVPPPPPKVPGVTGQTFEDAKVRLNDLGFHVKRRPYGLSEDTAGMVSTQVPAAGSEAGTGSLVTLWVPRSGVRVPVLFDLDSATADLRALGLRVRVKRVLSEFAVLGPFVLSQNPPAGTLVAPGKLVTITVARADDGDCPSGSTPGYSPCLPSGLGDYDCSRSANGPNYTTPGVVYRVTGSDPYDLDRNDNGYGCE